MDRNTLLDLATDLGYELSMSGAETFRVEESVSRVLQAYGVESEVFSIPNCLIVSIPCEGHQPVTRMRRIGQHGNDLDSVEKFNALSRRICAQKPDPEEGLQWLEETRSQKLSYKVPTLILGNFLAAAGFCLFFGGCLKDSLCSGLCGILTGFAMRHLENMKANVFFRTIASAFIMATAAYTMGVFGLADNADAVTIGALMLLVPGLLITNAMRDIIYGDTNSGVNRIVQVLLLAVAICLGTGSAWGIFVKLVGTPLSVPGIPYSIPAQCLFTFVACVGFAILFNIHGRGIFICTLGATLAWFIYCVTVELGGSDILGFFWSSLFSSVYAEIMARIRRFPAITYLVVAIFPMIPGGDVYYTMQHAMAGDMAAFSSKAMHTAAIAGIIAVGILLGSTAFRMYSDRKMRKFRSC